MDEELEGGGDAGRAQVPARGVVKGGAGEGPAAEDEQVAAAVEVFEDGLPLGFGPGGAVRHDEEVGVGERSGQLRGGGEGGSGECGLKLGLTRGGGVGGGEAGLGEDDHFVGGVGGEGWKQRKEQEQRAGKDFHACQKWRSGENDTRLKINA